MALQSGDLIGQYQIISQYGQGGMATVYKAYHPQLERNVAIKFLQQSFADDPNFRGRFEREAKIIASLDHPNIVPIYDFNYFNGQPYLVMKLIEGRTLKEVMIDNAVSKAQILDMLVDVANGLTYAHERGVLHRDIKPSNILIDSTNRPYITDFGLARMTQTSQSTMSQDMLMGTPHYMSPEQAKGTEELTPATDIYSLGVILYEFAVGQVPFSGNTPYAIVHDHIYTALPRPRDLNPDVSLPVETVLVRALAKNPIDRYATAVEMVEAFKQAVTTDAVAPTKIAPPNPDRTVATVPTSIPAPIPSYTVGVPIAEPPPITPTNNRSRWFIGTGILALLIVLALAAVILNGNSHATSETPLPTLAALVITPSSLPSAASSAGTTLATTSPTVATTPTKITIPDLSVEQAQTAVATNSNDPANYLALAKAAWQQNQTDVAQKAVQAGLAIAPEKITYLLTAAKVAQNLNRLNASIVLNSEALYRAQSMPKIYQNVRAQVGKALYTEAQTPDLINLRDIDRLYTSIPDFQPPNLFDIMSVQILVVQKRLPLAQAAFNRLSDATATLPEAYLVHGELLQAQGSIDKAKKEWKAVLQIPDAPQWVTDRVTELLNSN